MSETTARRAVGVAAELWRFPVKSMAGERLETAELTAGGLTGDRALGLIDQQMGKVVSAKRHELYPGILGCKAAFVEPPSAGQEPPPVRITLPDGSVALSDGGEADEALSALFGRSVKLARQTPANYRDAISAFLTKLGLPSPAPSAFVDAFPVSVITTSTLQRLSDLSPQSRFDVRRFRMNIVIQSEGAGFVENDWVGGALQVGAAGLTIALPDPRCVMTTLAQDDLGEDARVLETLMTHNRLPVGPASLPCAGVYAFVSSPGPIRVGDVVEGR